MKAKNAAAALLALLACASCSQRNEGGGGSGSLLPIDSFRPGYFLDYESWRVYLHGLHGVYGDKGFYGIVPALESPWSTGGIYKVSGSSNAEPITTERFGMYDMELDLDSASEREGTGPTNDMEFSFSLTDKGDEPPSMLIQTKEEGVFNITFTLEEITIGEGTIKSEQNLSIDYIRSYLSSNLFFA